MAPPASVPMQLPPPLSVPVPVLEPVAVAEPLHVPEPVAVAEPFQIPEPVAMGNGETKRSRRFRRSNGKTQEDAATAPIEPQPMALAPNGPPTLTDLAPTPATGNGEVTNGDDPTLKGKKTKSRTASWVKAPERVRAAERVLMSRVDRPKQGVYLRDALTMLLEDPHAEGGNGDGAPKVGDDADNGA